jgi:hypothetical protein
MGNAAGARVGVGHPRDFLNTTRIKKMQDRHGRATFRVEAQKAVPERANGDGGDLHTSGVHLAMQLIETIDDQLGELFRINFRAAIGRGADLIRNSRTIAFDLFRFAVEQQRANRGTSDVEAYNEEI